MLRMAIPSSRRALGELGELSGRNFTTSSGQPWHLKVDSVPVVPPIPGKWNIVKHSETHNDTKWFFEKTYETSMVSSFSFNLFIWLWTSETSPLLFCSVDVTLSWHVPGPKSTWTVPLRFVYGRLMSTRTGLFTVQFCLQHLGLSQKNKLCEDCETSNTF